VLVDLSEAIQSRDRAVKTFLQPKNEQVKGRKKEKREDQTMKKEERKDR